MNLAERFRKAACARRGHELEPWGISVFDAPLEDVVVRIGFADERCRVCGAFQTSVWPVGLEPRINDE